MKVYIAGKITGDPGYKEKFAAAVEYVEKNMEAVAISPTVLPGTLTKADYMRICLAMVDSADLVLFLPDWEDSQGARLEMQYCLYTGKRRMELLAEALEEPAASWRENGAMGWSVLQMIMEDVALRERVKELEARLAEVTAERDAAVRDIEEIMSDTDDPICGYCARTDDGTEVCRVPGGGCNAKWRGIGEAVKENAENKKDGGTL